MIVHGSPPHQDRLASSGSGCATGTRRPVTPRKSPNGLQVVARAYCTLRPKLAADSSTIYACRVDTNQFVEIYILTTYAMIFPVLEKVSPAFR
jgi:hypothetical protein